MLEYLPFLMILFFFVLMMVKSRVEMLRRVLDHPLTPAILGVVFLYSAITESRIRGPSIFFLVFAIVMTVKSLRKAKQGTQPR